jgi:dolichyl-phosphate beta-glucosyltransferase
MKLSIIIPCYNEERRIGTTLERMREYLSYQNYKWEIIVVDNGSSDGTRDVVRGFQDSMPNLRIVEENCYGKGWAVRQGMLAARGDYRLFTDADNSTDIAQVDDLLQEAYNGYDVVISSRRAEGAVIIHPQPWYRRILGDLFVLLVRLIVPLGIKDTQNGFKLFSREAAEGIFPHQNIFYWAFDVEILALADRLGYTTKEVPIVWVNDERSSMSIKGMVRMLFEVLLVRAHLMTRSYTKAEKHHSHAPSKN